MNKLIFLLLIIFSFKFSQASPDLNTCSGLLSLKPMKAAIFLNKIFPSKTFNLREKADIKEAFQEIESFLKDHPNNLDGLKAYILVYNELPSKTRENKLRRYKVAKLIVELEGEKTEENMTWMLESQIELQKYNEALVLTAELLNAGSLNLIYRVFEVEALYLLGRYKDAVEKALNHLEAYKHFDVPPQVELRLYMIVGKSYRKLAERSENTEAQMAYWYSTEQTYRKIISVTGNRAKREYFNNFVQALIVQKKYENAIYEISMSPFSETDSLLAFKVEALIEIDQLAEAKNLLTQLIGRNPGSRFYNNLEQKLSRALNHEL